MARPKSELEGKGGHPRGRKDLEEKIRETTEKDDHILMVLTAGDRYDFARELAGQKEPEEWDIKIQTIFMVCRGAVESEGPKASSARSEALPWMLKKVVGRDTLDLGYASD